MENDQLDYTKFMLSRFQELYTEGLDVWTDDISMRKAAQNLSALLPASVSPNILDIGAGRCRDSRHYLDLGFKVTAVDPVRTDESNELVRTEKNFEFISDTFQSAKLTQLYDGVIDNGSFHHQQPEEFDSYLSKVWRSLKAGGVFQITVYATPQGQASRQGHLKDGRKGYLFSQASLTDELESNGFDPIQVTHAPHPQGGPGYLIGYFKKPIKERLLLICPLPKLVQAANQYQHHVTTLWHDLDPTHLLYPAAQEVNALSHQFFFGDLLTEGGQNLILNELRNEKFDRVFFDGPDEYIGPAQIISNELGFTFNSAKALECINHKGKMRERLAKSGLGTIPYSIIETESDLERSASTIGLPVIVKPLNSAGSIGIVKIENVEGLKSYSGALPAIMEKWVDGIQVSVEMMTTAKDQHQLIAITEKFTVSPPHFVECGGILPARLKDSTGADVASLVRQFLSLVDYRNGMSHTEVMITPDGPVIIESHSRSGGLIPFMVSAAFKKDMSEMYFEALQSGGVKTQSQDSGVAILSFVKMSSGKILKSNNTIGKWGQLPFIERFNFWVHPGAVVPETVSNPTRHGYLVVSGADEPAAWTNLETAMNLLELEYE